MTNEIESTEVTGKEAASESEFESSGERTGMHHPGDDGHTHNANARFWLTNDILAFLLSGTLPAIIAANAIGAIDLAAVPGEVRTAWLAFAGIATVWAFGSKAARVWFEKKSGGS